MTPGSDLATPLAIAGALAATLVLAVAARATARARRSRLASATPVAGCDAADERVALARLLDDVLSAGPRALLPGDYVAHCEAVEPTSRPPRRPRWRRGAHPRRATLLLTLWPHVRAPLPAAAVAESLLGHPMAEIAAIARGDAPAPAPAVRPADDATPAVGPVLADVLGELGFRAVEVHVPDRPAYVHPLIAGGPDASWAPWLPRRG